MWKPMSNSFALLVSQHNFSMLALKNKHLVSHKKMESAAQATVGRLPEQSSILRLLSRDNKRDVTTGRGTPRVSSHRAPAAAEHSAADATSAAAGKARDVARGSRQQEHVEEEAIHNPRSQHLRSMTAFFSQNFRVSQLNEFSLCATYCARTSLPLELVYLLPYPLSPSSVCPSSNTSDLPLKLQRFFVLFA